VLRAVHRAGGFFEVASARSSIRPGSGIGSRYLSLHPSDQASLGHRRRLPSRIRTFVVDNARRSTSSSVGRPIFSCCCGYRSRTPNPEAKVDLSEVRSGTADAIGLVAYAIENGVSVNGLSFHVGSQTNTTRPYRSAIIRCLQIIEQIRLGLDHKLEILDIGGGLPLPTATASATRTTSSTQSEPYWRRTRIDLP